jgi:N utilization substance protein B
MGARRDGRIVAVQTLYRYEQSGASLEELLDFSWIDAPNASELPSAAIAFAKLIITGCIGALDQVDEVIRAHLAHWDFTRVARVDLSLLRMGVYCLLFQPDIPPSVTIDEAVAIAKHFSGEDSYRFVNGVLDGVYRHQLAAGESAQASATES